ncbi:archaeosortase A [Methanospirillum lacunae]|uniref:Archaeosortase A n=1 Tax=Methanospirillum lacunae TaxID=668570 RepID=A0A2V2NBW4_9EURY|nr:archaeosortase A [Methanospirillum lacunae]PWR73837.1 archaeosortase A [Methanospirillum lacunae]
MLELFIPLSCVFFLLSLIPGRHRKYTAIIAWISIVCVLISGVPAWIEETNLLYPVMALLSLPFLWATIRMLLNDQEVVYQLTRAAGVSFLIYAPFAFYEPLGNALISLVISNTGMFLNFFNFPFDQVLWNTLQHGHFRVEIILACTGIQAIAIMLGVAAAVPTTWRQKALAFLLVVPPIYILNLFRNTGVVIAYTEQWFTWLPDITGSPEPGYASFFWAHNIIAEGLALVFLVGLAYGLFRLIPTLADFAADLIDAYRLEITNIAGRGR